MKYWSLFYSGKYDKWCLEMRNQLDQLSSHKLSKRGV